MRIFAGLWALLFAVFAVLQYNDPDPTQWIFIYGAAAMVCASYALNHALRSTAIAVAGVALVWALLLIPDFIGKVGPADMFQSMQAERPEIEAERESGGLLVVVGVLGILVAVQSARRRKLEASAPAPEPQQE